MTKNFYQTNIRWDNALREDWVKPPVPRDNTNKIWHYNRADEILRKEWLEEWQDKGVPFQGIMLFYRPAWFINKDAHVDLLIGSSAVDKKNKMAIGAFNAVIGGRDSQMLWFDLPETTELDYRVTMAGTPYLSWPIPALTETQRQTIIGPDLSLVRVDVPHAIYVGTEDRWCLSLRTADMMSFHSWDAMVESYTERGIIKN